MGLAGRTSLARILLFTLLSGLPMAPTRPPPAPAPLDGGCGQPDDAPARFGYPPSQGPHSGRGGRVCAR
jgi:hypothetical protein